MSANCRSLAALCLLAVPTQDDPTPPTIAIGYSGDSVEFVVDHPTQIFLGGVIASLSDEMTHYLTGLPPILTTHVVLDVGVGYPGEGVAAAVPMPLLPRGVPIYAQGVALTQGAIQATHVDSITLPIAIEASGAGN